MRRASDAPIMFVPSRADDPELAAALAGHRLQTVFQPQFDLASGRLVGAEALARMPGGADARGLFRRAAKAGLAERLSREIQRDALRLAAGWDAGMETLGLAINVLPEDIARPGYADWLLSEIAQCGISARRVTIELTENSLIDDFVAVSARLERLRGHGLKVGLDDFGTGFASLANLARLPLDVLKIDRGLVTGIEHCTRERLVVRGVVQLAQELGLTVLVEGVESAAQLDLLRGWGCDLTQGFIHARPMPPAQFRQFAALHA